MKETSSKAAYVKYPAAFTTTLEGVDLRSVTMEFRVAKDSFKIYAGSKQI